MGAWLLACSHLNQASALQISSSWSAWGAAPPAQPSPQLIPEAEFRSSQQLSGSWRPLLQKCLNLFPDSREAETLCLSRWDLASSRDKLVLCSIFSTTWDSHRSRSNWILPKLTNWQFFAVLFPLYSWNPPLKQNSGTISLVILPGVHFPGVHFVLPSWHSCKYSWNLPKCKYCSHLSSSPAPPAPLSVFWYWVYKQQTELPLILQDLM